MPGVLPVSAVRTAARLAALCLILLTALSLSARAEPVAATPEAFIGSWQGELPVGGGLSLVFNIDAGASGLTATMDSPKQNARGIPCDPPVLDGRTITIKIPAIRGSYEGTLSEDGTQLEGTFTQGGSIPLTLTKQVAGAEPEDPAPRPQSPLRPFPYSDERVTFPSEIDGAPNPDVMLAGTLTLPEGEGPFPALILVTGSGPQDRDETLFGHKPFAVIADHLTKAGFAVLRYDDRGVGESGGDFAAATNLDFTHDAAGAMAFLRERGEIDPERVGVLGHSEGGIVAGRLSRLTDVDFAVLMASPAVPPGEIIIEQVRLISEISGEPPTTTAQKTALQKRIIDAVMEAATPEAAYEAAKTIMLDAGMDPETAEQQARQVSTPWFYRIVRYDPRTDLRTMTMPVFVFYGEKDLQVPPNQSEPEARAALSDNPRAEIRIFKGLNHMMQPADTGLIDEYAEIETTIDPAVLDALETWLNEAVR